MLKIDIPSVELFDPKTSTFSYSRSASLSLEHSLVSLSKWESKWKIHFLGNDKLTEEHFRDYVRCMTITQNVPPEVFSDMPIECLAKIREYMDDPMTATTISNRNQSTTNSRFVTSELIYAQMAILQIPFSCEKWHLNRLLTLIQVTNIEQQPKEKMSRADVMNRHRALNKARRKAR